LSFAPAVQSRVNNIDNALVSFVRMRLVRDATASRFIEDLEQIVVDRCRVLLGSRGDHSG
jgi:hypothetical protein